MRTLSRLVALRAFPYGRLKLEPGQEFDASSAADYRLLTTIGHARAVDQPQDQKSPPPESLPRPADSEGHTPPSGRDFSHAAEDVTIEDAITGPPAASERVVVPPGEEARPMTTQTIRQRPGKYQRKDLKADR